MTRKAVTIRDVARHAGVSVATASRALNQKGLVNAQTRERILSVMDELGFAPSPAARRLSLGRTLTVGVVVSFLTRPQAAERLRGVDAVLTDSEFDLVIYNVESVQKRDHYLATLAHSQRTDGLLVMSLPPRAEAGAVLARGPVPVVFIDVHTPAVEDMPRVDRRRHRGRRTRRRHLLELGHTVDRLRRRRGRGPVRVHLQPGPRARPAPGAGDGGDRAAAGVDRSRRPRSLRGARARSSDAPRGPSPDGDLRRQRHPGVRRHRGGPRSSGSTSPTTCR